MVKGCDDAGRRRGEWIDRSKVSVLVDCVADAKDDMAGFDVQGIADIETPVRQDDSICLIALQSEGISEGLAVDLWCGGFGEMVAELELREVVGGLFILIIARGGARGPGRTSRPVAAER